MEFLNETERMVWASVYAHHWATSTSPRLAQWSGTTAISAAVRDADRAVIALREQSTNDMSADELAQRAKERRARIT